MGECNQAYDGRDVDEEYFVNIHVKHSFEIVMILTLMIMTITMIMMVLMVVIIIMMMIVINIMIMSFVKVPPVGQRSQPQWR